jgi:hypothetical protein
MKKKHDETLQLWGVGFKIVGEEVLGWKHGKICQKQSNTSNHSHIYGINMKNLFNSF